MSARLRHFLQLFVLTLLCSAVVACSRIDLAYRNLDVLVPWSLSDYLNMNRQQKSWLDQRLKQHLAWHCRTQLPSYLNWLDGVGTMVANNDVTDQQLRERTRQAKQAIAQVADEITPSAAQLLSGMSDAQVRELRQAFADDIEERQAKYVNTPLARQVEERSQRMEKRLTTWLGPLNAQQRLRVVNWSQALGEQNRQWIDNRAHWQQQFSAAMELRQTPAFEPRLEVLLKDRESVWTPEYRIAYQRTEREARSLLVDLMAQSTPAQRQHLQDKLAKVREDFSKVKCL